MSILQLVTAPDPLLKSKSKDIERVDSELIKFMDDMLDTMAENHGCGLAAIQVGLQRKAIVIDLRSAEEGSEIDQDNPGIRYPLYAINPKILLSSETHNSFNEGCLSCPSIKTHVIRPDSINVEYVDADGKLVVLNITGFLARVFQHEIDHINGITLLEHMSYINRNMSIKQLRKIKNAKNLD